MAKTNHSSAGAAALSSPPCSSAHPSALKQFIGRSINKMGYTVRRNKTRTQLVFPVIPGWFSEEEGEALYLLTATTAARRILEIGHFLGRSTSAICEGIRDAGSAVEFNSYDLGLQTTDDVVAHYEQVFDTRRFQPSGLHEELVSSQNRTTSEMAKTHLQQFGLDKFVHLITGDFTVMDQTQYGFIFCDALHDHREIALILPHVIRTSNDDCVWAFHDMTPGNVNDVLSFSTARLIRVVDRLGIFRFQRQEEDTPTVE